MPAKVYSRPTIRADVESTIRKSIENGGWKPGFRLPAERELAGTYGCARMTVRLALRDLEAEGLIIRRHGSGTFVADLNPISSVLTIKDIGKEIVERGHSHHSTLLSRSRIGAGPDIAKAMHVATGTPVFRCEVIHYENSVPIQLEERFVNARLVPDFLALDLESHTVSSYLFERAPLTGAQQVVEAVNADERLAAHLEVALGAALLLVSRQTTSQGEVASVARLYHPGHAYRLLGVFSTDS
jgi:GntR family transcriptional regulator, histidine utilization repressor